MPSFINTNIASLNTQRSLNASQSSQMTALQRLSSGMRINTAKDDAAGLSISNRMTSQISGANQAVRNANDGISLVQTAEGDLSQIGNNLQRMRDLAVQSSNATNTASDRAALDAEVQALAQEIDRVATNSSFNGIKLLDGSFTAKNFQVGANASAQDSIQVTAIASSNLSALGVESKTAASVTGTATTAALAAGDLTLNGIQVGASTNTVTPGGTADSAISIATAINAVTARSGVTATANATTVAGAAPAASGAIVANTFTINGVNVGAVAAGGTVVGQGANVAAAINLVSAQSGVTASAHATTGAVTLTAADGRNIAVGGTITNTGLTAATTHGTVSLSSTSADGIVLSGGGVANGGFTAATTAATTAASNLSTMNVLTSQNASSAITTIDLALSTVNNTRASLGAYQNRFSSVVSSLQTTSENLTASRSRIQDTDFAAETATLSRAQILQQAGTAMLAQANQLPSSVMSLLR